MRVIRFLQNSVPVLGAMTDEGWVYPLPQSDFISLVRTAEEQGMSPLALIRQVMAEVSPIDTPVHELELLVPIEAPEVWAAGVTYERSLSARNYEATGGKLDASTFYDKVYDAERPEIFFKSTAARTIGPNQEVYLRSDSDWQIPEPELGIVIDHTGVILGYTIGNDMSCRDIEGENPLYLPQAKIWKHSCAVGPAILLAESVADPYTFQIACRIYRDGEKVVEGAASTKQLRRKLDELVSYLLRDNEMLAGTILLTGTGIVPPNEFTLQDGDLIEVEISGIGVLSNPVRQPSLVAQQAQRDREGDRMKHDTHPEPIYKVVMVKPADNVAVALEQIPADAVVQITVQDRTFQVKLREPIEFGHKFAVAPIRSGEDVVKYGEVIGTAIQSIEIGEYVHVHNVEGKRGRGDIRDRSE